MQFKDKFGNNLFYSGQLNNFDSFMGSIVGQVANYNQTGMFNINLGAGLGVSYVSGQGFQRNDGAGGVSLDQGIQVAAQDMNYVGFQAGNAGSDQGQSTITYANTGYLSGYALAMGTSMDVINGKDKIVYSDGLDASQEKYGQADRDNSTILLSSDAVLNSSDPDLSAKVAFYTATMTHEGVMLDQDTSTMTPQQMEQQAYMAGTITLAALNQKFGMSVQGSDYEDMATRGAYFALTGDADGSGLDMSGNAEKSLNIWQAAGNFLSGLGNSAGTLWNSMFGGNQNSQLVNLLENNVVGKLPYTTGGGQLPWGTHKFCRLHGWSVVNDGTVHGV